MTAYHVSDNLTHQGYLWDSYKLFREVHKPNGYHIRQRSIRSGQ